LNAARRDPTAQDGEEPTTAFVLDLQAPLLIALLVGADYAGLELCTERGLELSTVLRLFFGCERRGALSFAFSV
jgi:hypothetical protein